MKNLTQMITLHRAFDDKMEKLMRPIPVAIYASNIIAMEPNQGGLSETFPTIVTLEKPIWLQDEQMLGHSFEVKETEIEIMEMDLQDEEQVMS